MTEPGGIRLFLDRSTNGKRFAEAVKHLCPETVTIGDRYGVAAAEKVPDVDWIRDATAEGRICVGSDIRIVSNMLELEAVVEHSARFFLFPNNNLTVAEQIARFERLHDALARAAAEPGPWVHKLTAGGLNHTSGEVLVQRLAAARRRARL
ncbi:MULTISPECIES: hypothetical protein [Streptomyces]|uniref:VapC45 PIN like domain-containing protein n=1 Tax=Streptomyces brevispora TaxID=887462 RepID=A0ABZ1G5N0_9ACTN|nr:MULTISPECIES: hypothetical protein [Streptomyces]MCX4550381.1 hypothetical protein [Streptomyces sp. NBC_01500]WSC15218.1 hypothetical protein OIE64_21880 [Streptomyces brevispora]